MPGAVAKKKRKDELSQEDKFLHFIEDGSAWAQAHTRTVLMITVGLVLLVGLVTKNSILLIEFTNLKKAEGMSVDEALIEAGSIRLRPILMTAISTIAGILPVALGIGIGSESRQPMALVVAGGMLSSTFLTLIVVPVIYSYLDRFTNLSVFAFLKRKVLAEYSDKKTKEAVH